MDNITKHEKKCYICNLRVYPGTGKYYEKRLVHKHCYHLRKARNIMWKKEEQP